MSDFDRLDDIYKKRIVQLEAELAECKAFKTAIENELVVCGIWNTSHSDPQKAVKDVIQWNVDVALDPKVSSVAHEWEQERDALAAIVQQQKVALERIADTDPDSGTAWFHGVADTALTLDITKASAILAKRDATVMRSVLILGGFSQELEDAIRNMADAMEKPCQS